MNCVVFSQMRTKNFYYPKDVSSIVLGLNLLSKISNNIKWPTYFSPILKCLSFNSKIRRKFKICSFFIITYICFSSYLLTLFYLPFLGTASPTDIRYLFFHSFLAFTHPFFSVSSAIFPTQEFSFIINILYNLLWHILSLFQWQ
jgi:hypothetical protein